MKKVLLFLFPLLLSACYFDNEEDLYGNPADADCDVTDVSFSADVNPIIQANCITGCHSAVNQSFGIVLETYDQIKNEAQNERFFKSINHESGASPMPKNRPKLPQCDIDKIKAWIDAGLPNN